MVSVDLRAWSRNEEVVYLTMPYYTLKLISHCAARLQALAASFFDKKLQKGEAQKDVSKKSEMRNFAKCKVRANFFLNNDQIFNLCPCLT